METLKSVFVSLLLLLVVLTSVKGQNLVTIPDANFLTYLQTNYSGCMVGNQLDTTCAAVTNATMMDVSNKSIADLTGVQYFDSLKLLFADYNQLTTIPRLPSTLISLRAGINQLTSLPAFPPTMQVLVLGSNSLLSLPALPPNLESLYIGQNPNVVLPTLPASLKTLDVQDCNYATLPPLPSGLTTLIAANNPLHVLPTLPPTLEVLEVLNIQMTVFPTLPPTLTHLGVEGNGVTALPTLPSGLTTLYCQNNLLTSLPPLPSTLVTLLASNNAITSLPPLPSTMTRLEFGHNQVSVMPTIPGGMQSIVAEFNQLTTFPVIPPSAYSVAVNDNQITCFEPFPQTGSLNLYAVNNPFTCIPNYPAYMQPMVGTIPICTTGNIMGCVSGEGVGGVVYDDTNADCIRNGVDPGIQRVPVKLYDGSGTFIQGGNSHESGAYFFTQGAGTWTLKVDTVGKPYRVTCAQPGLDSTVALSLGTNLIQGVDFEVDCKPGFDVGALGVGPNGIIFPGQPFTARILAGDLSNFYGLHCATGVAGAVTVTYSGPATYTGTMPGTLTPTVAGNTFTYAIPDFGTVDSDHDFGIAFSTLTTATATDTICFDVTVTPSSGDNDPSNNHYHICIPVRNSHDPNAKDVYPTAVAPGSTEWLNYVIHFQNTGSAPAFNIHLEDTLDANLDWETLELLSASHYQTWNLTGNALSVHFPNIMLPDSASDEPGSKGYFQFRIKPKQGLGLSDVISNKASIYFDFNAAIVTNTATTAFNLVTGVKETVSLGHQVAIYPNPSNGIFQVDYPAGWKRVEWTLTDLMGHLLQRGNAFEGGFKVDLNDRAAGFYLLKVSDGRQTVTRQIVKQ